MIRTSNLDSTCSQKVTHFFFSPLFILGKWISSSHNISPLTHELSGAVPLRPLE